MDCHVRRFVATTRNPDNSIQIIQQFIRTENDEIGCDFLKAVKSFYDQQKREFSGLSQTLGERRDNLLKGHKV